MKERLPPGEGWGVIYVQLSDILKLLGIERCIVEDVDIPRREDFGRVSHPMHELRMLLKVNHPAFPRASRPGDTILYFDLEEARKQTRQAAERFGIPDPLKR
jgi:hypothetical protein